MNNLKDFAIVLFILTLLVVGFYAIWVLVVLFVGFVVYLSIPFAKSILERRPNKWK